MRVRAALASIAVCLAFTVFAASRAAAEEAGDSIPLGNVIVEFQFNRLGGQSTNQMALWIETPSGDMVKTIFATEFTARGGWKTRDQAIPTWVRQSGVARMTPQQIDAITSATPESGDLRKVWDCTNAYGEPVQPGQYVVVLEGTLRGPAQVVYRASVNLGRDAIRIEPEAEYVGSSAAERGMIRDVLVRYEPPAVY